MERFGYQHDEAVPIRMTFFASGGLRDVQYSLTFVLNFRGCCDRQADGQAD